MAQDVQYTGIARQRIPWFPTIDSDLCVNCLECVNFCQHGVYEFSAEQGLPRVVQPHECVVYCANCLPRCEAGAISFPEREAIAALIQRLQQESGVA